MSSLDRLSDFLVQLKKPEEQDAAAAASAPVPDAAPESALDALANFAAQLDLKSAPGAAPGSAPGEQDLTAAAAKMYENEVVLPESVGWIPREIERGARGQVSQAAQAIATPGMRAQLIQSIYNGAWTLAELASAGMGPAMREIRIQSPELKQAITGAAAQETSMAVERAAFDTQMDPTRVREELIAAQGAAQGTAKGQREGIGGDIARATGQSLTQFAAMAPAVALGTPVAGAAMASQLYLPGSSWTAGALEYIDQTNRDRAAAAMEGRDIPEFNLSDMRDYAATSAVINTGVELGGAALGGKIIGKIAKTTGATAIGQAALKPLIDRGMPIVDRVMVSKVGSKGLQTFARLSENTLEFRNGFFGKALAMGATSAIEEGGEELVTAALMAPFTSAPLSEDIANGLYSAMIGLGAGGVGGVAPAGAFAVRQGVVNVRDSMRPETDRERVLRQIHTDAMQRKTNWSQDLTEEQNARLSTALDSVNGMDQEQRGTFLRELGDRRIDARTNADNLLTQRQQLDIGLTGALDLAENGTDEEKAAAKDQAEQIRGQISTLDEQLQLATSDAMMADAQYSAVAEKIGEMPATIEQAAPEQVLTDVSTRAGVELKPTAMPKNGARAQAQIEALGRKVVWFRPSKGTFSPAFHSMRSKGVVYMNADAAPANVLANALEEVFHDIQMFQPELAQVFMDKAGLMPVYQAGVAYAAQGTKESEDKARMDRAALAQAESAVAQLEGEQPSISPEAARMGAARIEQEGAANAFAAAARATGSGSILAPLQQFAARRGLLGRDVMAAMAVLDAASRAAAVETVEGTKPVATLSPLARTLLWANDMNLDFKGELDAAESYARGELEPQAAPQAQTDRAVSGATESMARIRQDSTKDIVSGFVAQGSRWSDILLALQDVVGRSVRERNDALAGAGKTPEIKDPDIAKLDLDESIAVITYRDVRANYAANRMYGLGSIELHQSQLPESLSGSKVNDGGLVFAHELMHAATARRIDDYVNSFVDRKIAQSGQRRYGEAGEQIAEQWELRGVDGAQYIENLERYSTDPEVDPAFKELVDCFLESARSNPHQYNLMTKGASSSDGVVIDPKKVKLEARIIDERGSDGSTSKSAVIIANNKVIITSVHVADETSESSINALNKLQDLVDKLNSGTPVSQTYFSRMRVSYQENGIGMVSISAPGTAVKTIIPGFEEQRTYEGGGLVNRNNGGDAMLENGGMYAFGNLHEFVAEAINDTRFQDLLRKLPSKKRGSGSMFSRLMNTLRKFLGIDQTVSQSMLDDLMNLTTEISQTDMASGIGKPLRRSAVPGEVQAPPKKPITIKGFPLITGLETVETLGEKKFRVWFALPGVKKSLSVLPNTVPWEERNSYPRTSSLKNVTDLPVSIDIVETNGEWSIEQIRANGYHTGGTFFPESIDVSMIGIPLGSSKESVIERLSQIANQFAADTSLHAVETFDEYNNGLKRLYPNLTVVDERTTTQRGDISYARADEDAEVTALRQQIEDLKRQMRDVQNTTAAQRVNALREVRVLERKLSAAQLIAEQKIGQAARVSARLEIQKQVNRDAKQAAQEAAAKMSTDLESARATVASLRQQLREAKSNADTEDLLREAEKKLDRVANWSYAIGRNEGLVAGQVAGMQQERREQLRVIKPLKERLPLVEARLAKATEDLRAARKQIAQDEKSAQKAVDFAYQLGLRSGQVQGMMRGRQVLLRKMAQREDTLQRQLTGLRDLMTTKVTNLEALRTAISQIATDAARTLPVRLRGPLAIRIANAKTIGQANRIAVEATKLAINEEVSSTLKTIARLKKQMNKRGMKYDTRVQIETLLRDADAALRQANRRRIQASVGVMKNAAGRSMGAAIINAVNVYSQVADAAAKVDAALVLYTNDAAAFKAEKEARVAKYQADTAALVANMQGRPNLPMRDRTDQPPRTSLARRIRVANSDIYTLQLELEGKSDGIINKLLTAAQQGKGASALEHAAIIRQLEPLLQAAGYSGLDDYALKNGMMGQTLVNPVTVTLGGGNVTIPVGTMLSIAAMDDETLAIFPKAGEPLTQGIRFPGSRTTTTIYPTREEIMAIKAGLTPGQQGLVDGMKAILETQIRDRTMDAIWKIEGDQPPIVQNYWPRIRDMAGFEGESAAVLNAAGALVRGALTSVGFANARTGGNRPLLYSDAFQTWDRHVQVALDMIHMAQPYRDAATVLSDQQVVSLMDRQMGPGTANALLSIFSNGVGATARTNATIIDKLTNNVTGAVLSLSPRTWAKVATGGVIRLASEVGPVYLAEGTARATAMLRSPAMWQARVEQIHSQSGYFTHRHQMNMRSIMSGSMSEQDRIKVMTAAKAVYKSIAAATTTTRAANFTDTLNSLGDATDNANIVLSSLVDVLRGIDENIMLTAVEARLAEAKDQGYSGAAAFAVAVERAEQDFRRSQNSSDEFDETAFAAETRTSNKSPGWRLLFPFSSDTLKARNQIRRAWISGERRGGTALAIGGNLTTNAIINAASVSTLLYIAKTISSALGGADEPTDEEDKAFAKAAKELPVTVAAELSGQVGGYIGLALQGMITATMYRRAPMQALVTRPLEQATREAAKIGGEDGSWAYLAPAILAVAQLRGVPAYQLYSFVAKQIPEAEKTPQEKLQKRLQTIEQRFSPEEIRRRVLQRAKNAGRVSIPLP